jgi:uncharacterized delta-60 repeat protein
MIRILLIVFIFLFGAQAVWSQVTEEWVARYDGSASGNDWANDIAVDGFGNVYVTGRGEADYTTIKYDNNGDIVWVRRYGNGRAYAIAVDDFGNVYATGYGWNGTGTDFVTIMYNSIGDTLWVRKYNGFGDGEDRANDLVVDSMGNVYVTGRSERSGDNYDYATIKYSSVGDTLWVRRYNGLGDSIDVARSIAVDDSGCVYVTGDSWNGTKYDYATIKYNSNGDTVWVRRYDGLGNSWDNCYDLAVDDSGNVYVTGSSNGDYATLKYNNIGDTVWARNYNGIGNSFDGAYSIAVDDSENVYVTGASWGAATEFDYATIKYDSDGNSLWVRRYNGVGNDDDRAYSIAVDNSGNIYVTGRSVRSSTDYDYTTIKYDNNGDTVWVRRYNGPLNSNDEAQALAVDLSGNVYVTGQSYSFGTNYDYATIKYDNNGDTLWVRRYDGPGNGNDLAWALDVDGFGNVYVTGWSWNGTDRDYATIKYSNIGDSIWVKRYNADNRWDYATAISVDGFGNVCVTGVSYDNTSNDDYATIKYNSNGDTLWLRRYNGPGNEYDYAYALATDSAGNVYVTGSSGGEYATIKYDNTGNILWESRYDGGEARDLALDDSGNVYVTGSGGTIKYNSSGNELWVRGFPGSPQALDVDSLGNVYVTGGNGDCVTIKYSSNGDTLWVAIYDGPEGRADGAYDLKTDNSGNVYVTGISYNIGSHHDYLTIKYNIMGDTVWVRRYNGPGNGYDFAEALTVDDSGNVYVTGESDGNGNVDEYGTIKYDRNGNEIWVMRYLGAAHAIFVDDFNNVYVTGEGYGSGTDGDYVTIKYSQTVGIEEGNDKFKMTKLKYRLFQNQPNPFSKLTAISYQLKATGHTTLKIYDISGRLVETLVDKHQKPGVYQVEWDGRTGIMPVRSGVYFYRLTTGGFTATKKLILFK